MQWLLFVGVLLTGGVLGGAIGYCAVDAILARSRVRPIYQLLWLLVPAATILGGYLAVCGIVAAAEAGMKYNPH